MNLKIESENYAGILAHEKLCAQHLTTACINKISKLTLLIFILNQVGLPALLLFWNLFTVIRIKSEPLLLEPKLNDKKVENLFHVLESVESYTDTLHA